MVPHVLSGQNLSFGPGRGWGRVYFWFDALVPCSYVRIGSPRSGSPPCTKIRFLYI